MRLIDADKLLEGEHFILKCKSEFGVMEMDVFRREVIDNAQTVEQECFITGEQWNQFMQEHRRPQGEWLHPYTTDIACECSNCHRQMPITDYYNFCPNCGAEMKRESENA